MARQTDLKAFGSTNGKRKLSPSDRDIEDALGRMSKPSSRVGYRLLRLFTYGIVIAFIGSAVYNAYAVQMNSRLVGELRAMTQEQYNPSVKVRFSQLGSQVITAWYNGGSQPVTLADGIQWPTAVTVTNDAATAAPTPGTTSVDEAQSSDVTGVPETKAAEGTPVVTNVAFVYGAQTKQPTKDNPNAYVEHLTYSATVNGSLQYITILLRIDNLSEVALPTLVAQPSFVNPDDVTAKQDADSGPSDLGGWKVNSEQLAQLESWAKAYTTDDRATLKRLTGDQNKNDVFVGLISGNWEYVPGSIQVVWSKSMSEKNNGYVRITWQIQEDIDTGLKDPQTKETIKKTYTQTQTMDLLVTDKETALLSVIDWGEAGSYDTLTKYGNALTSDTAPAYTKTDQGAEK